MTKSQRSGFLLFVGLIIVAEIFIQFYPFHLHNQQVTPSFTPTEEALMLKYAKENVEPKSRLKDLELTEFNPNALDENGFEALGFSEKQAKSLIKYRYSLGGNFSTVEDFKNAYVVSDFMFKKLEPFIDLKTIEANKIQSKKTAQSNFNNNSASKVNLKPFNPNTLNLSKWMELGFSEKQAQVIIKYKNSLPKQQFSDLNQIKSCFVINDYKFNQLKPYIRIEKVNSTQQAEKPKFNQSFNPNTMLAKDWEHLGFSKENAENIVKYKEFKGGFNNLQDVESCNFITAADYERIKNQLIFE